MQVSKPHKSVILKKLTFIILCIALGWYLKARTVNQGMMGAIGAQTPYVLVQEIEAKDTTRVKNQIAHVEAINAVNLMPKVNGTIKDVLFEEGSFVKEGDLLFVIDPSSYQANVDLKEAELAHAQAGLKEAEKNYNRQVKLSKQNIASQATFDAAESAYLQAKAAVKKAKASLVLAKDDLDDTKVTAPISGYIGKALVTKGNYVLASSQPLARIVQISPVRVTFSLTDKEFLNLKQKYEQNSKDGLKARVTLPDGTVLDEDFKSLFVNNEVSSDTATVSIYTDLGNKQEMLIPGNYVKIALLEAKKDMNVIIPQGSLAQDEHGFYTYVVNENNVAEERRLELGEVIDSYQIVKSGLKAGEKVIIQGLQKVQNGMTVKTGLVQAAK
ncbi:MAG: efflux RND transporter periplasmic adaptor subunit [Alphaproteobacteria bacterium]|nr:efflux RND transporter periplasmic adaptor subunit [Alphaproteobacteria bacterium]